MYISRACGAKDTDQTRNANIEVESNLKENAHINERNRRDDRPCNFDRSRKFERRGENMQLNRQGPGPNNMGGGPPGMGGQQNMGGKINQSFFFYRTVSQSTLQGRHSPMKDKESQ